MAGARARLLCCMLLAAVGGKDAPGPGAGSLPQAGGLEHPGCTSIHP